MNVEIYNKNLIDLLEFKNMIEVSIHVCICALNRKESRGSHFRLDYPNQDINYEKNSFIMKENTNIKVDFEDVQWN